MSNQRYTLEFKEEAVRQVLERGHSVAEVSERLDVSAHSLYKWIKAVQPSTSDQAERDLVDAKKEILKLRAELRRSEEERDILKKAVVGSTCQCNRHVLCRRVKEKYAFMKARLHRFPVRLMCDVLGVHHSGFYAWLKEPLSKREQEDRYLLGFIKQFWIESGAVYGYRKVYDDMQSAGESCGKNRVHRLMKAAGIQSQRGYRRRNHYGGKPAAVAPNLVERQFEVEKPNQLWVTDITYSVPGAQGDKEVNN
ncbi:MAG: IS3 family transposase [Pseudomonadales bacterium]